jgi:hypothetical protein
MIHGIIARGNCAQRFAIHRIFILKQTNLKKHLEFYKAQLNNYSSQIAKSSSMADADQISSEMIKYHDDHIGALYTESQQALDDFQIDIMGVNVDDG